MIPIDLVCHAEAFCKQNRRLSTPHGSYNKCLDTARRLVAYLEAQGIEADLVKLSEGKTYWPLAHDGWRDVGTSFWWVHYVAVARGFVIDCTARQFDPGAAFPLVYDAAEIVSDWGESNRIDPFTGMILGQVRIREPDISYLP